MNFCRRYWLVIILASLVVILAWLARQRPRETLPQLKQLQPAAATMPANPRARLLFDRDLAPYRRQLKLLVEPQLVVHWRVSGRQLLLSWQLPPEDRHYAFRLFLGKTLLTSWSYYLRGRTKKTLPTLTPPPSLIPSPGASGAAKINRGDPRLVREMLTKLDQEYPLLPYLPFSNQDFAINYQGPRQLVIKIKGSNQAKVKEEALTWLRQHGYQPASHQIIWR